MIFRSYSALVRSQLTAFARSKGALFWSVAFPLAFLFLFGGIMARGNARAATFMLPGLLTTMLISGSLFGIVMPLVLARQTGVLRRFRVTPINAPVMIAAHGTTAIIQNALTFCLVLFVARLAFKTEIMGSLAALGVVFFFAAFSMVPLGLLVGSAARDMRSAPPIINLLFFPLMFLSGSAFPFALLPEGMKRFARFLPTTYIVESLQGVIVRGEGVSMLLGPLAILTALGFVGLTLSSMLFRWEGTEPISRRNLGLIVGAFAIVMIGSGIVAPAFRMGELPGSRAIEPGEAKGQVRVLRGGTVIDGLGGRIENARVVIRDHKVAEMGPDRSEDPLPAGAISEDFTGRYLIPGLFDSHIHLGGSGGVGGSMVERSEDRQVHDLGSYLAAGVTSVVSLTDDPESLARLRASVSEGKQRSPRVFFAGASITAPGGHPAEMFGFVPGLAESLTRQVHTPDEARAAVKDLASRDVDLIKLVLEPGFPGRPMKRLDLECFKAAVAEAKERALKVTVHVGTDEDARAAIDAGADGLEHAARGLTRETIALMAAKRVTFTPTLTVYDFEWKRGLADGRDASAARFVIPEVLEGLRDPKGYFANMAGDPDVIRGLGLNFAHGLEVVEAAAKAGVPILAGSDAGNPATFHGLSLIHELDLLARAKVPLPEILFSATSRPANRLGQRSLGRIEKGSVADLVLLGSDPLGDVAAYHDVKAVYLGGRKLDLDHLYDTPAGPWRVSR
jgi:imidazolonepropionase-like amidohydrolase/ABC-type polysaccharide/polyol phosphate export permease